MKYHNLDDYELIKQFQKGDQASFEALMGRYKSKVYTYILLTIKDYNLAQDIFQDTFLKVIRSLKDDKYNHTGRLLSWIVRIAHNLIIDHYRKINTNKTYSHEEKEMDFISNKYLSADSVEDEIVKDQVIRDVRKLVSMLPIEQREVIILRHYVGMSFKEIAEETNVSINTALGRMRYAVMNMRRMIKEHDLTFSFA